MDYLLYLGLIHGVFIILFLQSKPDKNRGEKIIIYWMVFLGLPLASTLSQNSPLYFDIPLLRDKLPYAFTFGPLLLLYTNQITGEREWDARKYIIHFSPFVIGSIYKLLVVPEMSFNPNLDANNSPLGNVLSAAILISTLGYSFATLQRLRRHQIEILSQFSSLSDEISLKWIRLLTFCLIASSFVPFLAKALLLPEMTHTRIFALLLFMYILSFFGLKQLQVFHTEPSSQNDPDMSNKSSHPELNIYMNKINYVEQAMRKANSEAAKQEAQVSDTTEQNNSDSDEKYKRSGLTVEKAERLMARLENHMQVNKPYLDINLTADKLALQLEVQRHYLTHIFSTDLNKNFYQFINEYRVDAVKELLDDPANHSMTLIDLAHNCGFNSKSTFNKIFKTVAGMTPSQYRKSISAKMSNA